MFFLVLRPIQAILSLGLLNLLVEASRPQSDDDVFRELLHAQSAGVLEHGKPTEAEKLAAAAIDQAEKKAEREGVIDDEHEKEKEAAEKSASPTEASPVEAGPTAESPADAGSPADASPQEASPANTSPAEASPEKASPSTGPPAVTSPEDASSVGSPADASPQEASLANTSPAEASPEKASPSAGSPKSISPAEASSVNTSPSEEPPASSSSSSQEERSQEIASPEGSSADATLSDQSPAVQSHERPAAAPSGSDQGASVESHQSTAVGSAAATSGDRKEFNHFHAVGTQADELHFHVATGTSGEGGGLAKKASGRAANAYKVIGSYQKSLEKLKLGLQANLRKHMEDLAEKMVTDLKHQDDDFKNTLGFEVPQDLKSADAWDGLPGGHVSSAPAPAELSDPPAEASPVAPQVEKVVAVEASQEEKAAVQKQKEEEKADAVEVSPPASQEEKVATVVEAHVAEEDVQKKRQELARLCEGKDRVMNDEDCDKAEAKLEASQAKISDEDSELSPATEFADHHDSGPSGAERDDVQAAAPALPDDEVAAVEKAIQKKLDALEDLCKDAELTEEQCREKKDVILAEKDEQLAAIRK